MPQSKLAAVPSELLEGQPIGLTSERVGSGGDAEVYQATIDGVTRALKVARGSGEALAREADVLMLACSTRMPTLHGVGWVREVDGAFVVGHAGGDARPFVLLDWCPDEVTEPGLASALVMARDVGGAIADAHAVGWAHGDVKRENVATRDQAATLLDWGLSSSLYERVPRGGTLRYLPTRDLDLGDARARDVLALGVLIAEECDAAIRSSADPIAAARRARLPAPVDDLCAALLVANPGARPSARWVEELAAAALGMAPTAATSAERAERSVRAAYLRARGDVRGVAPEGAALWLEPSLRWRDAIDRLRHGASNREVVTEVLPYLSFDELGRWLLALVGPAVASWPLGALHGAGETKLAAGLVDLAQRRPPPSWTLADVERAVLGEGGRRTTPPAAPAEGPAERAARIAVELCEVPPKPGAIEAVERDPSASRTLLSTAANALRLTSELGRARALLLRATQMNAATDGLGAEILRRAGDIDAARAAAEQALDDPRARAVLGRLAFDAGDLDGALGLVGDVPSAACLEVAALAHVHGGRTALALSAIERGEAYARTSEERARLAGARGYALAAIGASGALEAYRVAVDHAERAGMIAEEASYRTGEASAAVDEGFLSQGLSAGARAARLWQALGRPAMAARATLAVAAAHALLGAAEETRAAAKSAVRSARDGGDRRAEAYAWLAIADAAPRGSEEGRGAADAARAALGEHAPASDDSLRIEARALDHGAPLDAASIELLDGVAEKPSAASSARLDWWGARARGTEADPRDKGADAILAALVALASTPAALTAKGPALEAGLKLALSRGRPDVAERLRSPLRDAARTLVSRAGPELAASVTALPWVVSNLVSDGTAMDAEQVHALEQLVRSLGSGERLGPLLRQVLDALVLWTGVERGLLLLKAPDGRLVPRAARNFARADLRGEQATLSQSLARRALEALEPVVAVDAAGELPHLHQSVHALRLRSVLAVPLLARGEALGVAYLDDRIRRGAFGPKELAWTRTIAALASSMIADARDQVLLRRAVRSARRSNDRLAESLADREAKLWAAERTIEHAAIGPRTRHVDIVGESEPMTRLLHTVDRVAASNVPVLVVGESGSGKELVARAIHAGGARSARTFVSENCGAIPEGLLESALFGHVRGAFTGADRARAGLFDAADGGTLFLDEVGEMSLGMQAKLLRVLEDGMVRPLGTERERKVDVRIITATHRDLEAMVKERRFREDLLYRLNIITLRVPPLRERSNDIPLLVKRLVAKHAGERRVTVSRSAMERLTAFGWPGNVRQLENEIRRALVLADDVIDRPHLSPDVDGGENGAVAEAGLNVRRRVDLLESNLVKDALERTRGNQTQAAKLLGLSRFGLQKMIKRLQIAVP